MVAKYLVRFLKLRVLSTQRSVANKDIMVYSYVPLGLDKTVCENRNKSQPIVTSRSVLKIRCWCIFFLVLKNENVFYEPLCCRCLILHLVMVSSLNCLFDIYCKVVSTSLSGLEAHAGFCRLSMKGLKDEKVFLAIFWPKISMFQL